MKLRSAGAVDATWRAHIQGWKSWAIIGSSTINIQITGGQVTTNGQTGVIVKCTKGQNR